MKHNIDSFLNSMLNSIEDNLKKLQNIKLNQDKSNLKLILNLKQDQININKNYLESLTVSKSPNQDPNEYSISPLDVDFAPNRIESYQFEDSDSIQNEKRHERKLSIESLNNEKLNGRQNEANPFKDSQLNLKNEFTFQKISNNHSFNQSYSYEQILIKKDPNIFASPIISLGDQQKNKNKITSMQSSKKGKLTKLFGRSKSIKIHESSDFRDSKNRKMTIGEHDKLNILKLKSKSNGNINVSNDSINDEIDEFNFLRVEEEDYSQYSDHNNSTHNANSKIKTKSIKCYPSSSMSNAMPQFDKQKVNSYMRNLISSNEDPKKNSSSKQENEFIDMPKPVTHEIVNDEPFEFNTYQLNNYLNDNLYNNKNSLKIKFKSFNFLTNNQIIDVQSDLEIISDQDKQRNLFIFKSDDDFQINEKSVFSYCWQINMTIILAFQILVFPLENQSEPWLLGNTEYITTQLVFEWFFVVDLFINFFTSQKDGYGHVIKNLSDIVSNYLRTWFILDFISSIPTTTMEHVGLINQNASFNVYLRLLKFPKQIRVLKGLLTIFESRISSTIEVDWMISLNKIELMRLSNVIKQLLFFLQMINFLSCQMISLVHPCPSPEDCLNWFYPLIIKEYSYSLIDPNHDIHKHAIMFKNLYGEDLGVLQFQNHIVDFHRMYLYFDAWYFLVQTVTTVGYGDIIAQTTSERFLRSMCMIIGTILFSLLVSNFLEYCITETFNVQRQNEHEVMIEKLQNKYNMRGDPKRFLNLLGDSVYTESLNKELEFANLLPETMCDSVLKQIWHVYQNKMTILQEESLSFFMMMMRVSNFRRCVYEEILQDENKISIVYSGRIGFYVTNLKTQVAQEQLQHLGVGSEIGFHRFINFGQSNYMQRCNVSSEFVEIDCEEFVYLMTYSLKGLDQVQNHLVEEILESQLMVSLQQSMLKVGFQIDHRWYKQMILVLKFEDEDFHTLNKLQDNFTQGGMSSNLDIKIANKQEAQWKWFTHILDNETQKYIINKAKELLPDLISDKQEILYYFVKNFKKHYKGGIRNTM